MNENILKKYYIFSAALVLLVSVYPLYMGICVSSDMIRHGEVFGADYPKYFLPYTPISLAVITGVLLMPVFIKRANQFALLIISGISMEIFLVSELLFENKVMITAPFTLQNWHICTGFIPFEVVEAPKWRAVDVLTGEYGALFKLHFYIICALLILSFLNCFYGFAQIIKNNNKSKLKLLIFQSISSIVFLGLFILVCHTAFFRTIIYSYRSKVELKSIFTYFTEVFLGTEYLDLAVTPESVALISIFFVMFCITTGIYVLYFLAGKKKWVRFIAGLGILITVFLIMYIGELLLAKEAGIELQKVGIMEFVILTGIAGILGGAVNIAGRKL